LGLQCEAMFPINSPSTAGRRKNTQPSYKARSLGKRMSTALYQSIHDTLQKAFELGGRDTERDLYDHPGGYVRSMDNHNAGKPCPECGTPIEKASYLGGAVYFYPKCQAR